MLKKKNEYKKDEPVRYDVYMQIDNEQGTKTSVRHCYSAVAAQIEKADLEKANSTATVWVQEIM